MSLSYYNFPLQVKIIVSPLPSIVNDKLKCVFGSFESQAEMTASANGQVTCALPNPVDIPPTPEAQGETHLGQDFMTSQHIVRVLIYSGLALMSKLILLVLPEAA